MESVTSGRQGIVCIGAIRAVFCPSVRFLFQARACSKIWLAGTSLVWYNEAQIKSLPKERKQGEAGRSRTMQEIKFSVKMKVKTMYRFLMHHGYAGMSGIINLIISGGALVLLIAGMGESVTSKVALAIVAALFTVINPLYLYYKAAKQVKLTPMFAKPLDYVVNGTGLTVSQGEETLTVGWDELRKVVETGNDFYIYLSLTRAYIFPKENLAGQEEAFRSAVKEYTKPEICKCKFKA